MLLGLRLLSPSLWQNCVLQNRQPLLGQPPTVHVCSPLYALSKQGDRFLFYVATSSALDDPSVANGLIAKFVASSSKHVAVSTLLHILSAEMNSFRLSSLALPLYMEISRASWFSWNSKLVAELIALLYKQGQLDEAQVLMSETVSKLKSRERELCAFYCYLTDFHSHHKSKDSVSDCCEYLKKIVLESSSVFTRKQACKSLINGLCNIDLPHDAENALDKIRGLGIEPSVFEFRCVAFAYGRLRLYRDMEKMIARMEAEGFGLDTVTSNMILSSFGTQQALPELILWLQRMKNSEVPFSIRTYNSVLNSCQTIMSILQDPANVPLSVEELIKSVSDDEASIVRELIGSTVLAEAMEECSLELKLDLHGMHLGSAYLVTLQWFDEMQSKFVDEKNGEDPTTITVVCGAGKRSRIRGESPVKGLVKEMIRRLKCPLRFDKKNGGCFVVKGKVLKNWLLSNTFIPNPS